MKYPRGSLTGAPRGTPARLTSCAVTGTVAGTAGSLVSHTAPAAAAGLTRFAVPTRVTDREPSARNQTGSDGRPQTSQAVMPPGLACTAQPPSTRVNW